MESIKALHIGLDTTVTPLTLADPPQDQLRTLLGGVTVTGVYHRRAVLHILDDGQRLYTEGRTGLNLAAWALASAWRRGELYPLYGPVVITGGDAGTSTSLEDDLTAQVLRSAATVRETLAEWRLRPPASNGAAVAELLAYVRNDLRAVHVSFDNELSRLHGADLGRLDWMSTGSQFLGVWRPDGPLRARDGPACSQAHLGVTKDRRMIWRSGPVRR